MVTGGSSGIGLGAARRLAAEGANVHLVGRDPAKVRAAITATHAEALPGARVDGAVADVTHPGAMDAAVAAAVALGGRLDVLVAAAGIDGEGKDALELDPGAFAKVLDVNVRGLFLASQSAARAMSSDGAGGSIVLVASVNAFQTERHFADYNASKGAAVLLARSLAVDLADRGIRVNAICPGYVRTPMTEPYLADPATLADIVGHIPLGRVSDPDEIAATIAFLASCRGVLHHRFSRRRSTVGGPHEAAVPARLVGGGRGGAHPDHGPLHAHDLRPGPDGVHRAHL